MSRMSQEMSFREKLTTCQPLWGGMEINLFTSIL